MWKSYRKRFLVTQILICGVCIALKWGVGSPWGNVGAFFVVMQMSAVVGAWYGTRLARRIQAKDELLPLDRS